MWLLMGCPPNIYVKEIKHVQILNLSKVVKANTKLSDQTKELAKSPRTKYLHDSLTIRS
jgi:hypothetical protein